MGVGKDGFQQDAILKMPTPTSPPVVPADPSRTRFPDFSNQVKLFRLTWVLVETEYAKGWIPPRPARAITLDPGFY